MAGARCDQCGVEEYMPYVCKFCKGRFCAAHRLPENHNCQGLGAFRERARAEGKVYQGPDDEPIAPRMSTSARAGASMDAFWSRVDGKMTWIVLGICVGVYILEWIVAFGAPQLFDELFVVSTAVITRPWTIITSIFSHDPTNVNHIVFNMLGLVFFGSAVEKLIGTRRYTYLFLGAGAIAGLSEVFLMKLFFNQDVGALGASGALQGLLGTLVILAPTLTVLVFFVIPAPLWALSVIYILIDVAGVVAPGSSRIANIAHLTGFAIGAAYGWSLRRKGLRAVVRRTPPMWNR